MKVSDNYLSAKYDLVVIDSDKIEIWDWKTESQNASYKNIESRMQTVVYMYLAKEVVQKIYKMNIPAENITMNYFRLKVDQQPITINYTQEKHMTNKFSIEKYINKIENADFDGYIDKNKKHCKYCEFNKLCNNESINYEMIKEDE